MRLPDDVVLDVEIRERRHRVDGPLDALARTDQAPAEQPEGAGPVDAALVPRRPVVVGPVWHDVDPGRVDRAGSHQSVASSLGHRHDRPRARRELLDDGPLAARRRHQHRVQHDDDRSPQPSNDVQYVVPVRPTEDAELVLHDDHIGLVEHGGDRGDLFGPTANPLVPHLRRCSRPVGVDDAHRGHLLAGSA